MPHGFNYHRLLYDGNGASLSARLDPDARACAELETAAKCLMRALRHHLSLMASSLGLPATLRFPRFRVQGSAVYQTRISRAHSTQQFDLDLGLYLPHAFFASLLNVSDSESPITARAYFALLDALLVRICGEQGWQYPAEDRQRPHCCRIVLDADRGLQIDLPLYLSPDADFTLPSWRCSAAREILEPKCRTVIACRTGNWVASDVRSAIRRYAAALSSSPQADALWRLWRYVKAWRDLVWKYGGGPPSILLMEACTRACSEPQMCEVMATQHSRDDVIVQGVFRRLEKYLRAPVVVEWDGAEEDLSRDTSPSQFKVWSTEAHKAAHLLRAAAYSSRGSEVFEKVSRVFGERVYPLQRSFAM
jgi:hypothetical protein